jgi:predicted PurR-regulated permease PerM
MDNDFFKKILTAAILVVLLILAFFLLKPILLSIIMGLILVFIFSPVYDFFNKKIKSKNITTIIICFILLAIIVIPVWLLTPVILDQAIKIYLVSQEIDLVTPLKNVFPSLFESEALTTEVIPVLHSFINKAISSLMNSIADFILNFPTMVLQFLVVFFTFFFVLRDKSNFVEYIKSLLPFPKDVEKKLFEYSKGITASVLYGQVIIGTIQGIITSIGFFLFGVPNAFLLLILATLAGIFPIIGTAVVWVPVSIYLIINGNILGAVGVAIFGFLSSIIDNLLRPVIVSKRTHLNSSLVLIGMIGGLFMFGILGIILGPLIIAYLVILLEIYRKKNSPGILLETSK